MGISVGQIRYNVFQINETEGNDLNVDCYLVKGEDKAVLIDTLQDTDQLYETVRKLSDLPLEVIITHGHPDHAGHSIRQFHEAGVPVYMHEADIDLYCNLFRGEYPREWFTPLEDEQIFDLGNLTLRIILLAGHTPGSVVVLDEKNGCLYSGDAVGSGHFWMQIPGCIPLHEFHDNLKLFIEKTSFVKNLKIYPGHRYQSPVQLNRQYLLDTLSLSEKILDHSDQGNDQTMMFDGEIIHFRECAYGMMLGYCYNPENL